MPSADTLVPHVADLMPRAPRPHSASTAFDDLACDITADPPPDGDRPMRAPSPSPPPFRFATGWSRFGRFFRTLVRDARRDSPRDVARDAPDLERGLVAGLHDQLALPPADVSRLDSKLRRLANVKVLYLLPLLLWIFLFSSGVALIPDSVKPTINTTLLPRIDNFFGQSVYWFANDGTTPFLDILAAVPYTIHPLLPVFYLVATLLTTRHHKLLQFVFVFGMMNLVAVCTHLIFPTAPPWYFIKYGTAPASYAMKGDPAVLARLDTMFSMQMYHKMYAEGGKVVFGAWPSLHAAWPYMMARFRPGLRYKWMNAFQWIYMLVVWWAAIYLQHHYAADVVGGVLYAELAMWLGRLVFADTKRGETRRSDFAVDEKPGLPYVAVAAE